MNTTDILFLAWPYIGLGGGVAIFILLFFTDVLRSDAGRSRWHDPVWLAWAIAFIYLPHVCEEYSLHVTDGMFDLITNFRAMGVDERFGGIPLAFFPLVNILLTWVAFPVAAVLAKRNPVIGLTGSGFILINGLTHLGATIRGGLDPWTSTGSITGIFGFLPLFIWICYVCRKESLLPEKGLSTAVISGVLTHAALFGIYIINKFAGHGAAFVFTFVVASLPILLPLLLCRLRKIDPVQRTAVAESR